MTNDNNTGNECVVDTTHQSFSEAREAIHDAIKSSDDKEAEKTTVTSSEDKVPKGAQVVQEVEEGKVKGLITMFEGSGNVTGMLDEANESPSGRKNDATSHDNEKKADSEEDVGTKLGKKLEEGAEKVKAVVEHSSEKVKNAIKHNSEKAKDTAKHNFDTGETEEDDEGKNHPDKISDETKDRPDKSKDVAPHADKNHEEDGNKKSLGKKLRVKVPKPVKHARAQIGNMVHKGVEKVKDTLDGSPGKKNEDDMPNLFTKEDGVTEKELSIVHEYIADKSNVRGKDTTVEAAQRKTNEDIEKIKKAAKEYLNMEEEKKEDVSA